MGIVALPRWFSPVTLLLVMIGGALGVAVRAALTVPLQGAAHPLVVPAVTLGINLLGSLLLGVVVGALGDRHARWRVFLGTGMLGGFTTYSAFAVQVVTTGSASPVIGLVLLATSVFGGVVAAGIGLSIGHRAAGVPDAAGIVEPPEDAE